MQVPAPTPPQLRPLVRPFSLSLVLSFLLGFRWASFCSHQELHHRCSERDRELHTHKKEDPFCLILDISPVGFRRGPFDFVGRSSRVWTQVERERGRWVESSDEAGDLSVEPQPISLVMVGIWVSELFNCSCQNRLQP